MKSDQELQKKFKASIENGDVINLIFLEEETGPEDSARLAELVEQSILKIINENPQKSYNGIVDITALKGKVSYLAGGIREIYAKIMAHGNIKNIAVVGSSLFFKVAINLIVQAAGKSENVKWFSSREEALEWLK